MIIRDDIIFVHIPRTSGTAVRRALCHGEDPNLNIPYPGSMMRHHWRNQKHAFPRQIRDNIPKEQWQNAHKFTVVRNPYDRMVSLWGLFSKPMRMPEWNPGKFFESLPGIEYRKNMPADQRRQLKDYARSLFALPFDEWVRWAYEAKWQACGYLGPKRPMVAINQIAWTRYMDTVLRFEKPDEIDDFLEARGYPRREVENAFDHKPWQEYYDKATAKFVTRLVKTDCIEFGYEEFRG